MENNNRLGESLEMYLETILLLEKEEGKIRSVDIAKRLNVSKPSVNKAVNLLKELGYISQETYGDIHMNDAGRDKAQEIYLRHEILTDFLVDVLHVSLETAENDACKIEHVISDETFTKLKEYMNQ